MPFRKRRDGSYLSPSGKVWTESQVKLYYATHGFEDKPRKKTPDFRTKKRSLHE